MEGLDDVGAKAATGAGKRPSQEAEQLNMRVKELEEQLQGMFVCMDDQVKIVQMQRKENDDLRRQVRMVEMHRKENDDLRKQLSGSNAQPSPPKPSDSPCMPEIPAPPPAVVSTAAPRPPLESPGRAFNRTPRLALPGTVSARVTLDPLAQTELPAAGGMQVTVLTPTGRRLQLGIHRSETAGELRQRLLHVGSVVGAEHARLLLRGVPLKPDRPLQELGVVAGDEIRMMPPVHDSSGLRCHYGARLPDAKRGLLMTVDAVPWRPAGPQGRGSPYYDAAETAARSRSKNQP